MPEPVPVGKQVRFWCDLLNSGPGRVAPGVVTVILKLDPGVRLVGRVNQAIPAGQTVHFELPTGTGFVRFGQTGTYPYQVMVDPADLLAETDETNNVFTGTVSVTANP